MTMIRKRCIFLFELQNSWDKVLKLEKIKHKAKWEIQYPENRKKVQSILLLFDAWPPKYAGPVCAIYQDN